jgi:hypothetical protein
MLNGRFPDEKYRLAVGAAQLRARLPESRKDSQSTVINTHPPPFTRETQFSLLLLSQVAPEACFVCKNGYVRLPD